MNLRTILFSLLLLATSAPALADTYLDWESEISRATNGLSVCMESYERSLSGKLSDSQKRAKFKEAERVCRVLKGVFDTTMLTARTRVEGMDKTLADFHDAMDDMFEHVKPNDDPSMLSYHVFAQKTRNEVAEALLVTLKLSQVSK